MMGVEKLMQLNGDLSSILEQEYEGIDKPTVLVDIAMSSYLLCLNVEKYNSATQSSGRINTPNSLDKIRQLISRTRNNLLGQIESCLNFDHVFKRYTFAKEIEDILREMQKNLQKLDLEEKVLDRDLSSSSETASAPSPASRLYPKQRG